MNSDIIIETVPQERTNNAMNTHEQATFRNSDGRRVRELILPHGRPPLRLGDRTLIMGILNVTPDSFSDGGQFMKAEAAVKRAKEMIREGADLIDIGGESTRPGHDPVTLQEELERVIPIVRALAQEIDVPISIDTYKAEVARQALEAGAHIINDVWGCLRDPGMRAAAAEHKCPIVLMHNRLPEAEAAGYSNLIADVIADLLHRVRLAREAGVADQQIILDPGIGFAKDHRQNLALMGRLKDLAVLGYPLLLGTSRKRVIRHTLNVEADDAVEGTAATTALAALHGCAIVRVHDVRANRRTVDMLDAIAKASDALTTF